MAGTRKAVGRRKGGAGSREPPGTVAGGTAGTKAGTTGKKRPAARATTKSRAAKPGPAKAASKRPDGRNEPPPRAPDAKSGALPASILRRQQLSGYALLIASATCLAIVCVWVANDGLDDTGPWALRVVIRGSGMLLVVFCLWTYLRRRIAVSAVLMIGVGALCLAVFETGSALRADRARGAVNRTLLDLEAGHRKIARLTPAELNDPYIEAYAIMRDVYWQLYLRSDDAMSRYRTQYRNYTTEATFLDATRLTTEHDILRSKMQIEDLLNSLQRVDSARPDISDLLLIINTLRVDIGTVAAYIEDLQAARDSFLAATREAAARERRTLRAMRYALESLLETAGRYRILDGRLIFDSPRDAARFAGSTNSK